MRNEFTVVIAYGFADMQIDQIYRNNTNNPIETVFVMPKTDTFSLTKIEVVFYELNGDVRTELETEVLERSVAI